VGGSAHAVGLVALRARDAVHRAHHRRSRGRRGDHAVPMRVAETLPDARQFLFDVLAHLVQLVLQRRIVAQEDLAQPHRAQRLRERVAQNAVLARDQLRAAPADIHNQQPAVGMRPAGLHSQVNQPRLLASGNDLDRSADGIGRPFHELGLNCARPAPRWWPPPALPPRPAFDTAGPCAPAPCRSVPAAPAPACHGERRSPPAA
jgi:hypothetical protein